jgi:hypothetical protein
VFATNEDHRVLSVKEKYKGEVFPLFLKFVLQNEVPKLGYGYTHKLGTTRIAGISVKIPITPEGHFDLKEQKRIAGKYKEAYRIKNEVVKNLRALSSVTVNVEASS